MRLEKSEAAGERFWLDFERPKCDKWILMVRLRMISTVMEKSDEQIRGGTTNLGPGTRHWVLEVCRIGFNNKMSEIHFTPSATENKTLLEKFPLPDGTNNSKKNLDIQFWSLQLLHDLPVPFGPDNIVYTFSISPRFWLPLTLLRCEVIQ
jgi:hypothetical protein